MTCQVIVRAQCHNTSLGPPNNHDSIPPHLDRPVNEPEASTQKGSKLSSGC